MVFEAFKCGPWNFIWGFPFLQLWLRTVKVCLYTGSFGWQPISLSQTLSTPWSTVNIKSFKNVLLCCILELNNTMMPCLYYVVLAQLMSVWFVDVFVMADGSMSSKNVGQDELKVISFHPEGNEGWEDSYTQTASWGKLESVLKLPKSYTICSSMSWPNNDLVEIFVHVFFTLLGQDGNHFLSAVTYDYDTKRLFSPLYFLTDHSFFRRSGNISLVFPYLTSRILSISF